MKVEHEAIPIGICQCGCGRETNVLAWDRPDRGLKKGDYRRFVNGHQKRNPLQVIHGKKKCANCSEVKSVSEFRVANKQSDPEYTVYSAYCNPCYRVAKRPYQLEYERYVEMIELQDNKCAICDRDLEQKPYVDHCHKTGKVRGLLCSKCNMALGGFEDDVQRLERAIEYLDNSGRTL